MAVSGSFETRADSVLESSVALEPEQIMAARVCVARNARDAHDARKLMEALGLLASAPASDQCDVAASVQ